MAAPKGNKYALGLENSGRPPHFETVDELRDRCVEYFEECELNSEKANVTGLTLFLGFCSRSSLDDYCKRSDEFSYIIKRAKLAVAHSYENNGNKIDIFMLKNMGYEERVINQNEGVSEAPQINIVQPSPPKEEDAED